MGNPDPQLGLFPDLIVANWLPDETLFSLVSRHHRLSSNTLPATTCRQVFGHKRQGSAHDFPSRINELVHRTNGTLGSADGIIYSRTLLPYYLPFRNQSVADDAYAAMQGGGIGPLKYKLGILTSRFRAHHPLKACVQCLIEDREKWGVAYWHRHHQWPGAWVCLQHGTGLWESVLKATKVERFGWHLPHEDSLVEVVKLAKEDEVWKSGLLKLIAENTQALASVPKGWHFEPKRLIQTYETGLAKRGFMCGTGTQRNLSKIAQCFTEFVRPLRVYPEFHGLPGTEAQAASQVTRLLTEERMGTHPLRHVVFISWIFGTWSEFWKSYHVLHDDLGIYSKKKTRVAIKSKESAADYRRQEFMALVKNGAPVSAASNALKVDPATGMAWAAALGISTPSRAKVFKEEQRKAAIKLLQKGMDKGEVAGKYSISVSTVTKLLRSTPGLQQIWHTVRHKKARLAAQEKWCQVLAKNPSANLKLLRNLEPAAFVWLYRNDKAWLEKNKPTVSTQAIWNLV